MLFSKTAILCATLAAEKKAEQISLLDVSALTSVAENFVICSAGSERQAQAIARHVLDSIKGQGASVLGVEGLLEGHWILIDLGDVVFHVFSEAYRQYYDLDGFWVDAPSMIFEEGKKKRSKAQLAIAS